MERVPVVELPFASECQHERVVYHYVDERGNAQAVALHKERREAQVALWWPKRFYHKRGGGREENLTTKELEGSWQAAVLAAYEELPGHRYEHNTGRRLVHTVYVRVNGKGFYAELELVAPTLRQAVWVDEAGRIW